MCGIVGIFGHKNATGLLVMALHALQHRGQESAGMAVVDWEGDGQIVTWKGMGLVREVFTKPVLGKLRSSHGIGHVRYSTGGPSLLQNAQPLGVRFRNGSMAVAHNGQLENAQQLRHMLEAGGALFQSSSDTEVILHLILSLLGQGRCGAACGAGCGCVDASAGGGSAGCGVGGTGGGEMGGWIEMGVVGEALARLRGAYSLLLLGNDGSAVAARDPHGFRPLVWGKLPTHGKAQGEGEGDGYDGISSCRVSGGGDGVGCDHSGGVLYQGAVAVASETCALRLLGVTEMEEIPPGGILTVDAEGRVRMVQIEQGMVDTHVEQEQPRLSIARCLFELVYFSRPDSQIFGHDVYGYRKELGRRLAAEAPMPVDCVLPVPDSGIPAAIGYAQALGVPFEMGLIRSHYVGRTFIQPTNSLRQMGVRMKLAVVPEAVRNKSVAVVDDSIVRATTARRIVAMLREAGAKSVHFCVASPPVIHPCRYGINTPDGNELAASMGVDEVLRRIGADSLSYLSVDAMLDATGQGGTVSSHDMAPAPSETNAPSVAYDHPSPNDSASAHAPHARSQQQRQQCTHGFCTACWTSQYPL